MTTSDPSRRSVIAVVDDDQSMLDSLGLLLESSGYDVRPFSSAALFLASDELRLVDCLISDLGMPEMDGVQLAREAQAERPGLPIFFVTGRPELLAGSAVQTFGAHRSFTKPFDSRALLAAVAALLQGPHQSATPD